MTHFCNKSLRGTDCCSPYDAIIAMINNAQATADAALALAGNVSANLGTLMSTIATAIARLDALGSVMTYKGSVATYADLPTTDNQVGDTYNVIDTGENYAWTGSTWDMLGSVVDLSPYLKSADAATTYLTIANAATTYMPIGEAHIKDMKTNGVSIVDSNKEVTVDTAISNGSNNPISAGGMYNLMSTISYMVRTLLWDTNHENLGFYGCWATTGGGAGLGSVDFVSYYSKKDLSNTQVDVAYASKFLQVQGDGKIGFASAGGGGGGATITSLSYSEIIPKMKAAALGDIIELDTMSGTEPITGIFAKVASNRWRGAGHYIGYPISCINLNPNDTALSILYPPTYGASPSTWTTVSKTPTAAGWGTYIINFA